MKLKCDCDQEYVYDHTRAGQRFRCCWCGHVLAMPPLVDLSPEDQSCYRDELQRQQAKAKRAAEKVERKKRLAAEKQAAKTQNEKQIRAPASRTQVAHVQNAALINCPACQQYVSQHAAQCPNCGHLIAVSMPGMQGRRFTISTLILIALGLAGLMTFFVCSGIVRIVRQETQEVLNQEVLKFLGESDISVAKSQIGSLKKSLDHYASDCRSYPTNEQGLRALISPPLTSGGVTGERGWDGPYLAGDSVPADPWGLPFGYTFPPIRGPGPGPDIWSFGPDSMDGTADDIGNWQEE